MFLKVLLLGTLMSTFSLQAKAASAAEIAALQAKVEAGTTLIYSLQSNADAQRKTLERAQADANSAWTALSAAEKKFQAAKSSFEKSAGTGIFGFGQGEGTPELRQALNDAQAARDKAQSSYNTAAATSAKANRDLIAAGSGMADARAAFRDNSNELREQRNKLDSQLDRLIIDQVGLTGDFSALTAKAGSMDYALSKLSQKLDNALIGKYMQDKMKAVLNDKDTFCAAKNQCDGKGNGATDKALNKIFGGHSSNEVAYGGLSSRDATVGTPSSAKAAKTKQ